MKVGDLVKTIESWSYKTWTGVILQMEEGPGAMAKVLWTEVSQIDGQVFWAPIEKLELLNASR
tara:strand:+ start:227 stop:415 length:189 start_codon:yes stop_codon:yes gene_type:complete